MKTSTSFVAVLVASLIVLFAGAGYAQSDPATSPTAPATVEPSPTRAPSKLLYKPPADAGNIPTRVSGGARGENAIDTTLLALVPDHLALTTQAQPSLFWFQSKPAKAKFELTVVEPKNPKAVLSLTAPQ